MKITKPLLIATALALAVSALIEWVFVHHYEPLFTGAETFLFFTAFGLIGCIVIILVSKEVGHRFLMKHHDPYTGEEVDGGEGPHS